MNPPSQYEKIWLELKQTGIVKLTANPLLHSRIIKAVVKRKFIDVSFRIQMMEDNSTAILYSSTAASVITFTLVKRKVYFKTAKTRNGFSLKEI